MHDMMRIRVLVRYQKRGAFGLERRVTLQRSAATDVWRWNTAVVAALGEVRWCSSDSQVLIYDQREPD